MRRLLLVGLALCLAEACLGAVCSAQDLHVPAAAIAGEEATISTTGSGRAVFYLLGPGVSRKTDVTLGEDIHLQPYEVQNAGKFVSIVCSDTCRSATFYVSPAKPASLTFLVHPSRVPVAQGDAVSGVVLPFDQFHNLVLSPIRVEFQLKVGDATLMSNAASTQNGEAWFRAASGKSAGLLQVVTTAADLSARRMVQQVAADPCNLRIEGQRTKAGILVQTQEVHDCAGNLVPDGTIVTFTATARDGKSTVDAPIKQGVARAQIAESGAAVISVASGVVLGNELHVGAQP